MENLKGKFVEHLKGLESANNAEILKAIRAIREDGNENAIPFLVKTLVNNPDEDIKNEVAHVLFDLKNQRALPGLIIAIMNPENREYQHTLVAACWESGLNCTPFLSEFTEIAIHSDYLVTLESLTVIENMTGPFNQEELNKCIEKVRNAADEFPERFELLNGLWEVLVDFKAESDLSEN
jgi:HEAT repeat protein